MRRSLVAWSNSVLQARRGLLVPFTTVYADDSAKNALALAKVLAEAIGRLFIETALDS